MLEKSLIGAFCNRLYNFGERQGPFSCYGGIKANSAAKELNVRNVNTRVSRQFKVANLKSNLMKCHSYMHVIFNFFELSTLNFQLFEIATLNCRRTIQKGPTKLSNRPNTTYFISLIVKATTIWASP